MKYKEITKKLVDKIFEIGILLKAVFGFFEILGGILFIFSRDWLVNNLFLLLAKAEIAEDPNDFFAGYLAKLVANLAFGRQIFAILYLLFHGVINIFLAISLAKGKVKTYPAVIAVLCGFIFYQIYKYLHTFSLPLLALTLFDIFFVVVVWLEYRKKKRLQK